MTATTGAAAPIPVADAPTVVVGLRRMAREQLTVTAAQVAGGVGNLAFAVVMARVLAPAAFTDVAAFLVLYLGLHLPGSALGAATALSPATATRIRRRALAVGSVVGAAIAAGASTIAPALRMPDALVVLLGVAAPGAALLSLERGRLYATARHSRAAASLVAEPVVRLAFGVALGAVLGATGAGVAVVAGGYAALAVSRDDRPARATTAHRTAPAVAAFLLLAVVQNQDVVLASRVLATGDAARFAVLSTLGGIAAFATSTIPFVLLPRAGRRERGALGVALGLAVLMGAAAVTVLAVGGDTIVRAAFGARYASIAPLAAPYVGAMALLGASRVLVAERTAAGRWWPVAVVAAAAALQAALVATASSAGAAVVGSLAGTSLLAVAAGAGVVARLPVVRARAVPVVAAIRRPHVAALVGVTAVALLLRLLITRSVWVDEAISITQAKLGFGAMLHQLEGDVHPPLHAALLWITVRVFGASELAVRLPSIVAGTALVPVLFGAGRDLYGRRTGVVAATFAAVAPIAVWYSQEARMYALFMLFAALAVWAQARILRGGGRWAWIGYAAATAALLWTQYFAVLQVLAQQLVFAAATWRRVRDRDRGGDVDGGGSGAAAFALRWLGTLVLVAALVAPLVPYLSAQLHAYSQRGAGLSAVPSQAGGAVAPAQAQLSIYAAIANLLWAVGGYHSDATMARLAALWPLGMLAALLALGRRRSRQSLLVLTVIVVPAVALFVIGVRRRDVFELRYVAGIVPAILLVLARAVTVLAPRRRAAICVSALAAGVLLVGLADQQLNGTNPRLYDFRGALHAVQARDETGDTIVYAPSYLADVVRYYAPDLRARPLGSRLPRPGDGHRVFLVASFLDKRDVAARTGRALVALRHERRLDGEIRRPQIHVWEFE